ncbi:MAG: sigma 54-interacting transcriptional regulator [Acidobacteriota bacterium]
MSAGLVALLACEDPTLRSSLESQLSGPGLEVLPVATVGEMETALGRATVDLVLATCGRTAADGASLMHVARERAPDVPVLFLVEPGATTVALELLRHGAYDVLARTADPGLMAAAIQRAAERRALRRQLQLLRQEASQQRNRVPLLGRSERMREMSRQVDAAAERDESVLIVGSPGTGKNLVARELHARSRRAQGAFVIVSCLGVAEILLESQLIGHRRGAFLGAERDHDGALRAAAGGTLVIDRIEEMPLPLQARLAAVLRSRRATPLGAGHAHPVEARIVATSNRELEPMVRNGTFREDLHDLLSGATLRLLRLRDRSEDTPLLAEAFVAELAERYGVGVRRFDARAQQTVLSYSWPGNVKELREATEWAFVRGMGEVIAHEHLPATVRAGSKAGLSRDPERRPTLAEAEAELVALVLEESGGNKTEAARRLGIDRKRLYRKIKRYGLLGADAQLDDE